MDKEVYTINMMHTFANRFDAGTRLAQHLSEWKNNPEVIVLGLARGGVPVAHAIAHTLNLSLDVMLVRKLGVPNNEELAMGAIASGGNVYLNQTIIQSHAIPADTIELSIQKQRIELARRLKLYRGNKPPPDFTDKILILADDGIATGATVRVALNTLRQSKASRIVLAIPVAQASVLSELKPLTDQCHCLLVVDDLYAVGFYYQDFSQVNDQEVCRLLKNKYPYQFR